MLPENPRLSILFISVPVYVKAAHTACSPQLRFNIEMEPRINFYQAAPGMLKAMRGIEQYLRTTNLESSLVELVKMRASQINGCAYCLDMHSKDARAEGETEQRLYCLPAWRESPFYTDRERAALDWTEALTLVADKPTRPMKCTSAPAPSSAKEELVNLTHRDHAD